MQSENNEDSLQLNIEMPKEKKTKATSVISSWEFSYEDCNPLEFKLFLVVSEVYFRNLIDKKQQAKLNQSQRKRLGMNCLIVQDFQIDFITQDGQHRNKDPYRGEISLTFVQYRGLQIALRLGELELSSQDLIQARIIFQNNDQNEYKTTILSKIDGDSENTYKCFVDQALFSVYFRQHIAVEFLVRKQYNRQRRFRGIQNEGSTCYMNSTLQILFFLRPLRKTILDYNGKNNVLNVLKRIFIQMMQVSSQGSLSRPIDASDLISAYGRFPQPHRQQDIHEFLLGFLDELEGQCPQLKQLWIGNGKQILYSKQNDKPYTNNISQDFNEIDLLLEDHKGNTLGHMADSLNLLLDEEQVDDKIQTDQFGKVEVAKRREFIHLPHVVFFNLKRYLYKKQRNRPLKILTDFAYPPSIKLGFLQRTPTGEDQDYVLFGVAVHKGQTYNSGHYYSFVNTSVDPETSNWIKFNDSIVTLSSQETALNFTGGKRKYISWSREYHRFTESYSTSEETAYLLVYVRRDKFRQFQNIPTPIPRQWIIRKRAFTEKQSNSPTQQVQVCILDQNHAQFQPFDDIASFNITLKQEQQIQSQLVKMVNAMGCKIGTIWKVNRQKKKMKQLINYVDLPQTPARVFGFKRGHTAPDYLLLVPESHKVYQEGFQAQQKNIKLGIICSIVKREDTTERFYRIINKSCLQQFVSDQERKFQKKGYFQNKDQFLYDWNDFCSINFE